MATLSRLFISSGQIHARHWPDSCAGRYQRPAFDRIFMVTEPDGTFITARQFPHKWYAFTPSPLHDAFHLTARQTAVARWFALRISPRRMRRPRSGETILPLASPRRRLINAVERLFLPRCPVALGWAAVDAPLNDSNAVPLGFGRWLPVFIGPTKPRCAIPANSVVRQAYKWNNFAQT